MLKSCIIYALFHKFCYQIHIFFCKFSEAANIESRYFRAKEWSLFCNFLTFWIMKIRHGPRRCRDRVESVGKNGNRKTLTPNIHQTLTPSIDIKHWHQTLISNIDKKHWHQTLISNILKPHLTPFLENQADMEPKVWYWKVLLFFYKFEDPLYNFTCDLGDFLLWFWRAGTLASPFDQPSLLISPCVWSANPWGRWGNTEDFF